MGCTSSKATRTSETTKQTVSAENYEFKKEEECRKLFETYDADGSGTIELDEITTKLGVKSSDAKYILGQMDTDGSSGINYEEFKRFYEMTDPDTPTEVRLKLFFQCMDRDGSGTVNADEMAEYLASMSKDATPETFKEFCDEACKVKSDRGELCVDDFVSLKDYFVSILGNLENIGVLLRKAEN